MVIDIYILGFRNVRCFLINFDVSFLGMLVLLCFIRERKCVEIFLVESGVGGLKLYFLF